jgi:hypothetical protein
MRRAIDIPLERRAARAAKIADGVRRSWALMTPGARQARCEAISAGRRRRMWSLGVRPDAESSRRTNGALDPHRTRRPSASSAYLPLFE